jgi:hypothetical protein
MLTFSERWLELTDERAKAGVVATDLRGTGAVGGRTGDKFFGPTPEAQAKVAEELIEEEGYGRDEVPDLLTVHLGSTEESPNEGAAADAALAELASFLEDRFAEGTFALVVTADGGLPEPGSVALLGSDIATAIDERFGPVTQAVSGGQVFLDPDRLSEEETSPSEIAEWLRVVEGAEMSPSAESLSGPLFSLAVPKDELAALRCP